MITISQENFLKAVYHFSRNADQPAATSQLASRLGISNAAASEMAQKMARTGFVKYAKYKGVQLTKKGNGLAVEVIRKHRLWELFLSEVLGLSIEEVHDEAEKLEHQTSETLMNKIDEFLNFPSFDPHGHPIPNKDGEVPELPESIKLSETDENNIYSIIRTSDESKDLMKYFRENGFLPNQKIKVIERLKFDGSLLIEINGNEITISEKVADQLTVKFLSRII